MVTFLILLMMACNLWVLFYLTWEHKERSKAGSGPESGQRPAVAGDIMGKSRFRMPEKTPQATTSAPNAATTFKSEAVDEKDVTFADEWKDAGSPAPEASRRVPDEELDEVFKDNRVYSPDEDFDEEPPQAGGCTFDEIDLAARTVKETKAEAADVLQAGKVFHELEGTSFYDMFRRNNARYETRVSEMVEAYLASIRTAPQRTRAKAAVRREYENFNIRDYV